MESVAWWLVCIPSRHPSISVVYAPDWNGSYLPSPMIYEAHLPSPEHRSGSPSYLELTQGLVKLNDRSFSYFPWWHWHDPRLMMPLITVIIIIRNNNSSQNDVMKLSVHCQDYLLISRFTDGPSREPHRTQDQDFRAKIIVMSPPS